MPKTQNPSSERMRSVPPTLGPNPGMKASRPLLNASPSATPAAPPPAAAAAGAPPGRPLGCPARSPSWYSAKPYSNFRRTRVVKTTVRFCWSPRKGRIASHRPGRENNTCDQRSNNKWPPPGTSAPVSKAAAAAKWKRLASLLGASLLDSLMPGTAPPSRRRRTNPKRCLLPCTCGWSSAVKVRPEAALH